MFEIREIVGKSRRIIVKGLSSLGQAFIKRARLKRDNPNKAYTIWKVGE